MTRRVLAGFLLGLGVLILSPAAPASAHATLLFTTPTADGAVPTSPTQIQLVFNAPVTPSSRTLRLADSRGRAHRLSPVESANGGQAVGARVLDKLPAGNYVVTWQATAPDGDAMTGTFRFAVGSTAGLSLRGPTVSATKGQATSTAFRWLLFAGFAIALGGLAGERLARRSAQPRRPDPWPWLRGGTLAALAGAVGLALLLAGGGSLWEGPSRLGTDALLDNRPGVIAVVEILALGSAAAAFALTRTRIGVLALLVVPVAEGLRAHPESAAPGWGVVLIAVHLSAAGIWIGALVHVVRVGRARRRYGTSAAPAVLAYARVALWLFLTVLGTGVVNGLVVLGTSDLWSNLTDTTYGRWLLVKIGLVGTIAVAALLARRSLSQRPLASQPARAARVESVALVGVLGISALLTSMAPPPRADLPLPFPPPPVGPVSVAGGRAGWIGIGLTASSGQLVVRLTTPDNGRSVGSAPSPRYSLAANLATGEVEKPVSLRFRACGAGCFVAPVSWTGGRSTATVQVSSPRWPGGSAAIPVSWPPRPHPEVLRSAVEAMRQASSVELHERVTSDTRRGLGTPHVLEVTGRDFLAAEPYSTGVAPIVNLVGRSDGQRVLALGFPAEGIYARLTLDRAGRIMHETLTAPNHLVTRTFVYPEPDGDGRSADEPAP